MALYEQSRKGLSASELRSHYKFPLDLVQPLRKH